MTKLAQVADAVLETGVRGELAAANVVFFVEVETRIGPIVCKGLCCIISTGISKN